MIRLAFIDNQTAHNDLVLTLPTGEYSCDSYYFLIDRFVNPDDESPAKVQLVIHTLLGQWVEAIAAAGEADTVFLPFDFSDEYTGWLQCEFARSAVLVTRGWSEIGSVFPSQVRELMVSVAGFEAFDDAEPFGIDRETLLRVVEENRREFESEWA